MYSEIDIPMHVNDALVHVSEVKTKLNISIHKQFNPRTKLYDEWEILAEKSNKPVCMSPEWVYIWWKHFGINKRRSLYIISVYDDNKLVAVFPFYKGITGIGGKIIEQRLRLVGSGGNKNEQLGFSDDYGISDFLDFIVDQDYSETVAELFILLLTTSELSAHHITFHQVRDDSYIKQYLFPKLRELNCGVEIKHTDTCPFIDLTGIDTLQDFIKQSKSNARRRFRQTLRATGPGNEFIIEEAKSSEDLTEMINNLVQLHQERWNEVGFPGAFYDERFRNFFKEIVSTAQKNKRLWFKQAIDSRGVCASRMLLQYNGRYYDYMSGFNDESPSAKYRPGFGLLLNLIEDSLEQPVERIELLRGEEEYKYDFTDECIKNWKITIPVQNEEKTLRNIPVKIAHVCSIFYRYTTREIRLMKVQYQKAGFFKMFGGYFQFRNKSLKKKFK